MEKRISPRELYVAVKKFHKDTAELLEQLESIYGEVLVEKETEPVITEDKEGWYWPPKLKKSHYYVSRVGEDTGKSLCGAHEYSAANLISVIFEDESNCVKCTQVLAKREEKARLVSHLTAPIKESKGECKVIRDSPGIIRDFSDDERPIIKNEDEEPEWIPSIKDISSDGKESAFANWSKATNNGKRAVTTTSNCKED